MRTTWACRPAEVASQSGAGSRAQPPIGIRRRLEGRRLLLPGENLNIARMHRLVAADLRSGAAGSPAGDVALFLADRAADPAQVAAECADAEALATMLFDLTDPNSPLARVTRNSAHLRSPGMDLPAVATTLALAGLRDGLAEVRAALAPVIAGADGMSWLPVATSDRTDRRLARTLTGHADWVNDVALGHTVTGALVVATASHDTTVGLWRPGDGTRLATLTGHTGWASTVAFAAPPDPVLASGGWDGTIRFWNPSDGSALGCLAAHDGPVFDVAWGKLPDGRRIVAPGAPTTWPGSGMGRHMTP